MTIHDQLHDEELARLYREAGQEEPSPALDARILAAARAAPAARADRVRPPRAATSWVSSWRIPVALAATVLLTSTLTLVLRDDEAGRLSILDPGESVRGVPQPEARPADSRAATAPGDTPAAVRGSPEPPRQPRREPNADKALAPQTVAVPKHGPAASARSREESSTRPQELFTPDPPRAGGSLSGDRKVMQSAPARDDARSGNLMKDQALSEKARPDVRSVPSVGGADESVTRPAAAAPSASRAMSAPASAAKRAEHAESTERNPEQWLEDIRGLRLDGKVAEAAASLAEFRRRHPQYLLPDDLKQL